LGMILDLIYPNQGVATSLNKRLIATTEGSHFQIAYGKTYIEFDLSENRINAYPIIDYGWT
jgi:hypothetical protein